MRIIDYAFRTTDDEKWSVSKTTFGKLNLLVGDTGTGKTRLLNTIFNLGTFAANKKAEILAGCWSVSLEIDGIIYKWDLTVEKDGDNKAYIVKDNISKIENNIETALVIRDDKKFIFNGAEVPKLPENQTSIMLLQNEELIQPLFHGFGRIMRRRFSQDELEKVGEYQSIPKELIKRIQKKPDLNTLYENDLRLNAKLYLLLKFYTKIYTSLCNYYQEIFPFIIETGIIDLSKIHPEVGTIGQLTVFCIKEKGVKKWVELGYLSSGMQKVLLVLTDLLTLPEGSIYLIDEYENSLGANSIDFFPTILNELNPNMQFFITSHHPYIINNIPVEDWYVLNRQGSQVHVRYGQELVEKFGKSKQQAFIKLINEPYFRRGVE